MNQAVYNDTGALIPRFVYATIPGMLAQLPAGCPVGSEVEARGHRYNVVETGENLVAVSGVKLRVDATGIETVMFDAFAPSKSALTTATNDAGKLNQAIALAAGRRVYISPGDYAQSEPIVLTDGCHIDGGDFQANWYSSDGFTGWQIETINFDAAKANADGADANADFNVLVPENVRVEGLVLQGRHLNFGLTTVLKPAGHGARLYVRKPDVDLRVFNIPGKGVYSYGKGGNGPTVTVNGKAALRPGYSRQARVRLYIHGTKEEGLIWDGPSDVILESVYQCHAGRRIPGAAAGQDDSGKVSSPTYGGTNGGQTDGCVFETGAEIKLLHAWGSRGGCGLVQYGGRIIADTIIVESNHYGGIKLLGGHGQIANLDTHKTTGWLGDTTPAFLHDAFGNTGGAANQTHCIGVWKHEDYNTAPADRNGPAPALRLGSNSRWLTINGGHVSKRDYPGNAIQIDSGAASYSIVNVIIANATGDIGGGVLSAALDKSGTGAGRIQIFARDCDVAFRNGGNPTLEDICVMAGCTDTQTIFAGTARANPGQRWRVWGRDGTADVNVSGGIDAV